MVIEATPVVPRDEDRGVLPLLRRTLHDGVHHLCDPRLPLVDRVRRVVARGLERHDPAHGGERPAGGPLEEVGVGPDVVQRVRVRDVAEA